MMYVKINRNLCSVHLSMCERCFGKFLRYPLGYERRCFEEFVDDGEDLLTIDMISGTNEVRLVLDETQRQLIAGDGWAYFVDFAVPMYKECTEMPEKS
jgi:hypothetical protein